MKTRTLLGLGAFITIAALNFQYALDGYGNRAIQHVEATESSNWKKTLGEFITAGITALAGTDDSDSKWFSQISMETPKLLCPVKIVAYYYKDPDHPNAEPASRGRAEFRCGVKYSGEIAGYYNITNVISEEEAEHKGKIITCGSTLTAFSSCTPITKDDCFKIGFCKSN